MKGPAATKTPRGVDPERHFPGKRGSPHSAGAVGGWRAHGPWGDPRMPSNSNQITSQHPCSYQISRRQTPRIFGYRDKVQCRVDARQGKLVKRRTRTAPHEWKNQCESSSMNVRMILSRNPAIVQDKTPTLSSTELEGRS